MLLRTAQSAIAICQDPTGANYYVGLRLSDDAPIELTNVAVVGGQATATNPSDLTQYQVSRTGLQIMQNGQVIATAVNSSTIAELTSSNPRWSSRHNYEYPKPPPRHLRATKRILDTATTGQVPSTTSQVAAVK